MFTNIWNKIKGRRAQKAPRLAPLCQGHEETKRLAATNAAVDVDRLLWAIRRAGDAVATVSNDGKQEKGKGPMNPTSDQQVSWPTPPQVPLEEQSASNFPRFLELPRELRSLIWQNALDEPRLIYVHLGIPGMGAVAAIDRFVMNANYLVEKRTPRSNLLHTCQESSEEVNRAERADHSRTAWLARLGRTQYNPTRADLVYLGGLRDAGRAPPADANRVIPLGLVSGNILPRVMLNADVFVDYFALRPDQQPKNPLEKSLADLRTLGNHYTPLLDDDPDGLLRPVLPESMVFMLGNTRLTWDIASPCTVPGHNQSFIASCCIHYDHLEIISDSDMDGWMNGNLAHYDAQESFRIRMELVPAIRAIFAGWRGQPGVATQVPRLFFARIRPSE